jgi:Fe-S cluster biogenesis protein NfuA
MTEDQNAPTPAATPAGATGLYKKVDEVLDRIRPYVQADGGHVELVSVDEAEGVANIRFQGACSGCPSSAITLQMGIENEIRMSVPEIRQVVAV